ncbi:hypothetical protein ACJIZ3_000947 [Penstemon smallii]|uniref:Pentatricopeptide repeat-containing protein n=1 Tax=Penstemon smallii TaxID=265156 RepID=A0ABD3U2B3_9LAMI
MTMMKKVINRLILRKPSEYSPRWLSTASEKSIPVAQPRTKRSLLFDKVKTNPKSSITDILNDYQNNGNILNRFEATSLSNYFRKRKNYQSTLQLFEWMESNKLRITNADQAIQIDLLYKTKDLASAEEYFNSLQDSEKTNKTYGALQSCYCKEKALDKALDIFEKMKVLKYMSLLNYNNMLSLYYNIGQPEKVVSLVQEMEEKNFVPNLYTYNLLINSYAALKNLDAVEEILERMESKNVKCDLFTYGNLATIYFNAGLHEKANTYLVMMEKMENAPSEDMFEAARTRIKLYSEMNDLSGVNRAWDSLKSTFPTPNNTSYLFILLALSKLGDLERLESLFKEWENGCSYYDYRLPNVILEYYLKHNMNDKANALYTSMINRETAPNLRTLNLFATLCIKNSDIDLALKYLEMGVDIAGSKKRNWFPPDETVKLFLDYFEEEKDADIAEKFVQSMKKISHIDSKVYDYLLSNITASDA